MLLISSYHVHDIAVNITFRDSFAAEIGEDARGKIYAWVHAHYLAKRFGHYGAYNCAINSIIIARNPSIMNLTFDSLVSHRLHWLHSAEKVASRLL